MGICYIVGAGEFYGSFSPNDDDLVIAADGGFSALKERNLRCDLLLGDMDSLHSVPRNIESLRFKVEKDETDTYLAYLEGVRRGYTSFAIYGGVGGRADHTFANYCLLSQITKDGHTATLYDNKYEVTAIRNNATRVLSAPGKTVSVFAFGGAAKGVTIKGLYYELYDGTLLPEMPLGVSNHTLKGEGEISVQDGTLLIMREI